MDFHVQIMFHAQVVTTFRSTLRDFFSKIWEWVSIYYFILCSSVHKFLFSWAFWAPKVDYNSIYGICKCSVSYVFVMEFFFLSQPKLTMARCRRNVDNFLEACRKIGVEEVGSNNRFFEHASCCLAPFTALLQELSEALGVNFKHNGILIKCLNLVHKFQTMIHACTFNLFIFVTIFF